MSIADLTNELRKEFQKKMDEALVNELQQLELEELERQALAKELPGLTLPPLTASEEKKVHELIDTLDKQEEKIAELGANIGKVASEYHTTIIKLTELLANKKHNIRTRHTSNKIKYMLTVLSRTLEKEIINGVLGFCPLPSKEYIKDKLSRYRGI